MASCFVDQVDQAAKLLWNGNADIIQYLQDIISRANSRNAKYGTPALTVGKLLQGLPRGGGSGLSPFHCMRKLSTFRAVWGRFGPVLDIDIKDNVEQKTLLQHVSRNIKNGSEYVKFLLECNAAPDSKDRYGWTPLHEAARNGNVNALREVTTRCLIRRLEYALR